MKLKAIIETVLTIDDDASISDISTEVFGLGSKKDEIPPVNPPLLPPLPPPTFWSTLTSNLQIQQPRLIYVLYRHIRSVLHKESSREERFVLAKLAHLSIAEVLL